MRAVFIFLALTVLIPACKKYEEGPSISILSKMERLTGEWDALRYFENGVQFQLPVEVITMKMARDGTFQKITCGANTYSTNSVSGNWAFSDDKESLMLTYSASNTETWAIKRLTNNQLFIETTQPGGSIVRYEFVK